MTGGQENRNGEQLLNQILGTQQADLWRAGRAARADEEARRYRAAAARMDSDAAAEDPAMRAHYVPRTEVRAMVDAAVERAIAEERRRIGEQLDSLREEVREAMTRLARAITTERNSRNGTPAQAPRG